MEEEKYAHQMESHREEVAQLNAHVYAQKVDCSFSAESKSKIGSQSNDLTSTF
jgi:hypothetical protein